MKRLLTMGMIAALAMPAPLLLAADAQPAPGGKAKPAAPDTAEFDRQMAQAQENMKKMQEQMEKLRQTQDPQARQKLLQEHWATMQNNMQLMQGMWGPGMMGCCAGGPTMGMGGGPMMGMGGHMMGGPMWGDYRRMTPEQLRQRQYMMERYMPMQQMMMDHMMQHQHWMWPQPK